MMEALVAIPIMVVVFGAVLLVYRVAADEEVRAQSRAHATADQRIEFERLVREFRQAHGVTYKAPNAAFGLPGNASHAIEITARVREDGNQLRTVQYLWFAHLFRRWKHAEADGGNWEPPEIVVRNVANLDLFTVDDALDPSSVRATVGACEKGLDLSSYDSTTNSFRCAGAGTRTPISLSETVIPRNLSVISEGDPCEEEEEGEGCGE